MADFLAAIDENLYQDNDRGSQPTADATRLVIPAFTSQELDIALRQLKSDRAADSSGIIAEMLKNGGMVAAL
eukprot:8007976-Pyramimonas_sp.AAC.1